MDIQAAIDAPRVHMQWNPDKLSVEMEMVPEVVEKLRNMGWIVKQSGQWSLSQGVMVDWETKDFFGASDARAVGTAGPKGD